MPANSTAMYPEPTIATFSGNFSKDSASSESMPSSLPGISGLTARPPVAIKIFCAVTFSLVLSAFVISTVCLSKSLPPPSYAVTPEPSNNRP